MNWLETLNQRLQDADRQSARRHLRILDALDGPHVNLGKQRLLNLCHNDYLGLAREPEVIEAACQAVRYWGTGAEASRLITGSNRLLAELEATLAEFKEASSALIFPTGYQTSLGVITALAEPKDVLLVDRLAHACLVDGARLAGGRLRVFPHQDLDRLEQLLQQYQNSPNRWILVDGVYSMDGDIAPVPQLLELAQRYHAVLIVDDAHGTGVTGPTGRGTFEHFGLKPRDFEDCLIVVATLSKALGSQGGVVFGSKVLRDWLINRARTFIYTTGLAPPAAGAALAATRLLAREPQRVERLQTKALQALDRLKAAGLNTLTSQTAIIPVALPSAEAALAASQRLADAGFLALAIRPPTVPKNASRLRLTINNLLSDKELDLALKAVVQACEG